LAEWLKWFLPPKEKKVHQNDNHVFFFLAVLGFELRASIMSPLPQPFFVMGLFEIRSHKLFDLAGFEQ
jgi:hypothetical protein